MKYCFTIIRFSLESWTISLDHDGPVKKNTTVSQHGLKNKPSRIKRWQISNLTKKFAFVEKSEGIKVNYMLLIIIHYSNKLFKTFISHWYQNIHFKISGYLFTKKIPDSQTNLLLGLKLVIKCRQMTKRTKCHRGITDCQNRFHVPQTLQVTVSVLVNGCHYSKSTSNGTMMLVKRALSNTSH